MAITHVQTVANPTKQTAAASSVTETGTLTAGNLVVVHITTFTTGTSQTITSINDDKGNTYTLIEANTANADRITAIYYNDNVIGGTAIITATLSGTATNTDMSFSEYTGHIVGAALDYHTKVSGGSSTTPSITLIPTVANSLCVGYNHTVGAATTITEGQTFRTERELFPQVAVEDTIASGSTNLTWTLDISSFWNIVGATFKPALPTSADKWFKPMNQPLKDKIEMVNISG